MHQQRFGLMLGDFPCLSIQALCNVCMSLAPHRILDERSDKSKGLLPRMIELSSRVIETYWNTVQKLFHHNFGLNYVAWQTWKDLSILRFPRGSAFGDLEMPEPRFLEPGKGHMAQLGRLGPVAAVAKTSDSSSQDLFVTWLASYVWESLGALLGKAVMAHLPFCPLEVACESLSRPRLFSLEVAATDPCPNEPKVSFQL